MRLHQRGGGRVRGRGVVELARARRGEDGVEHRRVVPRPEVDAGVAAGPAGQPRGARQVRAVDDLEEGVPGGEHLAAEVGGVDVGQAGATAGGDGS